MADISGASGARVSPQTVNRNTAASDVVMRVYYGDVLRPRGNYNERLPGRAAEAAERGARGADAHNRYVR